MRSPEPRSQPLSESLSERSSEGTLPSDAER